MESFTQQLLKIVSNPDQPSLPVTQDFREHLPDTCHTMSKNQPWLCSDGIGRFEERLRNIARWFAQLDDASEVGKEHLVAATRLLQFSELRRDESSPLSYEDVSGVVSFDGRRCKLSSGNNQRLMKLLYDRYGQYVPFEILHHAFLGTVATNTVAQGIRRLRSELQENGLIAVSDAIRSRPEFGRGGYCLGPIIRRTN